MTDALKDLIARDEWLEVAKAITFAYVNAPKNPAKFAWVSAVEEGPYHIETNDSAANGGDRFIAICGAFGAFSYHLMPAQIFPSQKCKACLDLAGEGGTLPNAQTCAASGTLSYSPAIQTSEVADMATGNAPEKDSPMVGNEGAVTVSAPFDRHGDDRFADNILRALEGLPQNGDDLEERDAAEEGAAIEASGYNDPVFDRNGR